MVIGAGARQGGLEGGERCGEGWRGHGRGAPADAALGAGRAAGHEGEGRAGRWLARDDDAGVEHDGLAIEQFAHLDAAASEGPAAGATRDGEEEIGRASCRERV